MDKLAEVERNFYFIGKVLQLVVVVAVVVVVVVIAAAVIVGGDCSCCCPHDANDMLRKSKFTPRFGSQAI